ncbi:MAG TPA: hypothetical protein VMT16_01235 [Thermoanaerobaculia bacterium]|nr:hypothetical protein [Thermoanaerobaculia bacterium]
MTVSMTTITPTVSTPPDDGTLYRHTRRPEWGLAILAWERGDQRAYQFDDGKLRVLKDGFFHLMEPVADVREGAESRVAAELQETLALRGGERRKPLEPVYPFDDQLRIFRSLFPQGFAGGKWKRARRGEGGESLKRHRDPAIEAARRLLARDELDELLASDRAGAVVDRAVEVLRGTDLVALRSTRDLDGLAGEARQEAGRALRDLLYGDERYGARFRAWVNALRSGIDRKLSWRLVTALPALVFPDRHTCVRPSAFRKQAAVFAPDRLYSRRPMRRAYSNYLQVAEATRERLTAEGYPPCDLLDVYDFIWVTLRPSAAQQLEAA